MDSASIKNEEVIGQELEERPACLHHWVIEKPAGPTSKGTCRQCGEARDFQNYIEGSSWRYDVSPEQLLGGSRLPAGIDPAKTRDNSTPDE